MEQMTKDIINAVLDHINFCTYDDIIEDYNKLKSMIDGVKSKATLEKIAKDNNLYIEINGDSIKSFDEENEVIEWVRVEHFNNLDYIYFSYDKEDSKVADSIYFDVWCEEYYDDVIDSADINNIEQDYIDFIKSILKEIK